MAAVETCRFETDRLLVAPWHDELDEGRLGAFVITLLTPDVTAGLPPGWSGGYDRDRAAAWIRERDCESTVLLVRERTSGAPVGLLIAASDEPAAEPVDVALGFLLVEDRWGEGLASELVGGFVAWARAVGPVGAISGGVAPDNPASARALVRHGFEPVDRGPSNMRTYRLALPRDVGIELRPEATADHDAIRDVVAAAFGSPAEADLVDRVRSSPEYRPELALVAEVDGDVVGHVMISGANVRNELTDRAIVMLSPLAVAPDHQRRGIGAALVRTAVDGAERAGEPLVVVEGDPAYYRRFGFEHSARHGLVVPLPHWAPSEAGQVKLLSSHDPTDKSLRGEVVYPPAFDGLDD